MSATPGIAGIARITAVAPTNRSTMAVGAGIVAGDGTTGIVGTTGIIGGEFERGFGPFLILAASTIHYLIRGPFHRIRPARQESLSAWADHRASATPSRRN